VQRGSAKYREFSDPTTALRFFFQFVVIDFPALGTARSGAEKMTPRSHRIAAVVILAATLAATLSCSPIAAAPATAPGAVAAHVQRRTERAPGAKMVVAQTKEEAPAPKTRVVRRIKSSEMTVAVVKKARTIINEHYKQPHGFEVEFEIDGKNYLGRIEPHYHPPGGELRPWGHHSGCSLYVVEQG
jgi:hypothetical protein